MPLPLYSTSWRKSQPSLDLREGHEHWEGCSWRAISIWTTGILKQIAHCNLLERIRKYWFLGSLPRNSDLTGLGFVIFLSSLESSNIQQSVITINLECLLSSANSWVLPRNPRLYKQVQGRPLSRMAPRDTCLLELTNFYIPLCPIPHKELSLAINHMNK